MDALGAVVLVAGLFWLTRRTLAEGLVRSLNQGRNLPAEQIAAWDRLIDWLGALPAWPGGALIVVGGLMIWM